MTVGLKNCRKFCRKWVHFKTIKPKQYYFIKIISLFFNLLYWNNILHFSSWFHPKHIIGFFTNMNALMLLPKCTRLVTDQGFAAGNIKSKQGFNVVINKERIFPRFWITAGAWLVTVRDFQELQPKLKGTGATWSHWVKQIKLMHHLLKSSFLKVEGEAASSSFLLSFFCRYSPSFFTQRQWSNCVLSWALSF